MPAYHYRITVDMLHSSESEGGLQSLSFFASNHSDVFTDANSLRHRFDLSACNATKLALALSLISQV